MPERLHVGALAEQVNDHDGPGPAGDPILYLVGIEIPGKGIDVREHRPGAQATHRPGAGEEGKGRHNHLVAGTKLEGLKGQEQRVGARSATHRIPGAAVASHFSLEGGHFGTENHLTTGQYPAHGFFDLRL